MTVFHAVSRQILSAAEESVLLTGPHIRRRLIYFLHLDDDALGYEERYTKTFETSYAIYLQLLIKGDWAAEFAIRATADMLNLTIHILNDRGNWTHIIPRSGGGREILLGHILNNSFLGYVMPW